LSDAELRDFRAGALAVDDLLRADDHLSGCGQCRARAVALSDVGESFDRLRAGLTSSGVHLSDDELQLLVQGRLPAESRSTAERHLSECVTCAAQVEELRRWAAPAESSRLSWLAVAAAALLVVAVPAIVWQARSRRQEARSSLAGLDTLSSADQATVRAALDAGAASVPTLLTDLTAGREALMGARGPRADALTLVAPVSTATASDRPTFEWQPLDGARGYVVAIFDERAAAVTRSEMLGGTRWTPPESLPRDVTYVWQVTAYRGGETITAPAAPDPPATFHVIDAHWAGVLRQVEQEHPASHLLLGILEMQAGVRQEATRHLEQVPSTDRNASVAQHSLERLRNLDDRGRPQ
jgi:hypothetical protein